MTQPETLPLRDEILIFIPVFVQLMRMAGTPKAAEQSLERLRRSIAADLAAPDKPEAEAAAQEWYPEVCPITQRPFFMTVEHPEHGMVPTYGGPYDSYTIPERDDDGDWICERYDHDDGAWVEGCESTGLVVVKDSASALPSDKLRGLVRKWRSEPLSYEDSQLTIGQLFWKCAGELEALLSQEPSSGANHD